MEQLAEDDVTDISEARKIAFAGFTFLLSFALFSDSITAIIQDTIALFQQLDIQGMIDSASSTSTSIF